MLAHALALASRNFRVFPVHTTASGQCSCGKDCGDDAGKHPHLKAWQHQATTERDKIHAWWSRWTDANIGIATGHGLIVLDLDGTDQAQAFGRIAREHGGLEPTLTARTGRGLHLYLAGELAGSRTVDGLLVRGNGGYVIAPPSLHRSGVRYAWVNDLPLVRAPDWFLTWAAPRSAGNGLAALGEAPAWLHGSNRLAGAGATPWTAVEDARVVAALAAVPADCDRETWLLIGMALQSLRWERPDGTDRGYDIWAEWSAGGGEKYQGEFDLETRWRSFKRSGTTLGTLFHIAEQHGWSSAPPAWTGEEVMLCEALAIDAATVGTGTTSLGVATPLPAFLQAGASSTVGSPGEQGLIGEVDTTATAGKVNGHHLNGHALPPQLTASTAKSPLIDLNERYCVIGDVGGKCLVLGWTPSKVDSTIPVPSFQSFKSFSERYSNQYVVTQKKTRDGLVEEPAQLGGHWLKWGKRRSYDAVDYMPGQEAVVGKQFNLWRGWGVEPQQGTWSRMQAHIGEVLAGGNAEYLAYILRWAAWAVQHPGEPPETALVFRGRKGAGKGLFGHAMRRLFGQHGLHISSSKHLVGNFNAHLRSCSLLFADEAFWAGDKQGESTLKAIISERTLMIEPKGVDAQQWRNNIHLIMAANAAWVVPASHDERRYAMFDVADTYASNESWFDALHHEMNAGGLAAMLWDLQHANLGDWHPRRIVRTAALMEQQRRSMDQIHEWYESLLQEGRLPRSNGLPPNEVSSIMLWHVLRETFPRLRDLSQTALGRFLREQGAIKLHTAAGTVWRFRPLALSRAAWETRFGGWEWENDATDWQ